jgi:hypothetical protein
MGQDKTVLREKDVSGQPMVNGGWFAKDTASETSDAAIASMYANLENEHASAGQLIDRKYEDALGELIKRPRGSHVGFKDMRFSAAIGFVLSIPIVAGLGEAAVFTAAPLIVASAATALPAAGIAVHNAVLGVRSTIWKKRVGDQRAHDQPRIDALKALAYVRTAELSSASWKATEEAVEQLQADTRP